MTRVAWLTQTAAQVPADDLWLGGAERRALGPQATTKRRVEWRLGRWTAKRAVAAHLGGLTDALTRLEILAADGGAPEVLLDGVPAPVVISITHRDARACCAVTTAGAALGCDLERVEARSPGLVTDYFTPEEQALVAGAILAERDRLATLLWSAKESALKALRTGLRRDTRDVRVRLGDATPRAGWRSLTAELVETGTLFEGFWREDGGLVFTLVALPAPLLPIALGTPL